MYWSEYWYMGSMRFKSLITKYNTLPLIDTDLYRFLTLSISTSSMVDSAILWLISMAVYFAYSNDSMSSTLSRIFSASASANYLRMVASDSLIDFLYLAKFITLSSFYFSISGRSNLTTSAKSYSSRPSNVTVKLITVTLMKISGRYFGLGILLVMNNLKLRSKSIS